MGSINFFMKNIGILMGQRQDNVFMHQPSIEKDLAEHDIFYLPWNNKLLSALPK